jgi:DnaJ-class molecular chaperone
MDSPPDLYKALGVSPDASADDIKKAYRRLARKYHPDTTGGDKAKESKFKEISGAYDVLSDPQKRAEYDAIRSGRHPGFGAGGFGGGGPGGVDLGDFFSQFVSGFGGATAGGGPGGGPGGGRVRYTVYSGGDGFRGGEGGDPGDIFSDGGFADLFGAQTRRGRARPAREAAREEKILRASDGTRLVQRGLDIHSDLRLSLDEAILGAVKTIGTLSGQAKVKVPPGTSSGVKLRLKERGAAGPGGRHGNHYVTVHIDVPSGADLDEAGKRQLVDLMQKLRKA